MKLRKDYPYDLAIDDFSKFISRVVKDKVVLKEFSEILEDARSRKTFPMRGLHQKLMSYRRAKADYTTFTEEEREMIEDLMHFWG